MDKKIFILLSALLLAMVTLSSCNSQKNLVVPRSVSSAEAVPVSALNLQKNGYDILQTVTETASVTAQYGGQQLKIQSGDGDFSYTFKFDKKAGWVLDKFSGTANFGYLLSDVQNSAEALPDAEEFARRVAIARLIDSVKDYGADGVISPIITTRASNAGDKKVEYQATVTAKIIKIHPTAK